MLLAENDDLLSAVDKVLQSHFHKRVRLECQLQCKAVAINFLVSLCEGRSEDLYVHDILAKEFQPEILSFLRHSVMHYIKEHESLKKKKKLKHSLLVKELDPNENISDLKRRLLNMSSDDRIMEISLDIMAGISTLMLELRFECGVFYSFFFFFV